MKKLSVLCPVVGLTMLILSTTACSNGDATLNASLREKETVIVSLTEERNAAERALSNSETQLETVTAELTSVKEQLDALSATGPTSGATLMMEATNIIHLMKIQDFAGLSAYVSASTGLRVSPYQNVNTTSDILLSDTDVANLGAYPLTTWGNYAGSGDPISLTGMNYYSAFLYNADFENAPHIGQNTVLSSGNMVNNIQTAYPGDSYVEFYYDGFNPVYSGMDWTSITLVMRNISSQWYLVALVHGEWTT